MPSSHRAGGSDRPAGPPAILAGLTRPTSGPVYYLSLGDSLAQGIQPGPSGRDEPTSDGYADLLAARLRGVIPALRLAKLGCSGETTSTMIHGGSCRYPAGSQLAQAVRFLRSHRGQVGLVTIDIGANDPNSCVLGAQPSTIFGCLSGRMKQTDANLSVILAQLRAAAGRRVLIAGMTYYVPELGLWRTGQAGKEIAAATAAFAAGGNRMLGAGFHRYGARVADVFGAFRSADFSRTAATPVNVTTVCTLTWMCARPPRGPNEHPDDAGYRVIARAFWQVIDR